MIPLLVVFVVSLGVCAYVYFGYPALLFVVARLRPRPHRREPYLPTATMLIPVHNEEDTLAAKLRNTQQLDYPNDRLEVVVISDGSTDRSVAIARSIGDHRVRVEDCPRIGKGEALNHGAALARGEILVLSDANSMLREDSLRLLMESFADPEVGGVCGNKIQCSPEAADSTEQGEGLYWRYDKWQKSLESRIGSIFAADGALYAVRRDLYVPISDPGQADDIAISARVVLQGYRLVYEPRAVTVEEAPAEGRRELARKIRVTNHSVLALLKLGRSLWFSGFYSLELISHKLLRHFAPFFLIPLALSSAGLIVFSRWAWIPTLGQAAFYLLGIAGWLLRRRPVARSRLLSVPYYFSLVNTAALLGILSIVAGRRLAIWTPRGGLASKGEPR